MLDFVRNFPQSVQGIFGSLTGRWSDISTTSRHLIITLTIERENYNECFHANITGIFPLSEITHSFSLYGEMWRTRVLMFGVRQRIRSQSTSIALVLITAACSIITHGHEMKSTILRSVSLRALGQACTLRVTTAVALTPHAQSVRGRGNVNCNPVQLFS